MRRARAIKFRAVQFLGLNAMRRLRIGRRDFAQMRVRILLNAMVEAKSWVLRAKSELASNMSSTQRPEEFQGEGTKCQCFAFLARITQIATVF